MAYSDRVTEENPLPASAAEAGQDSLPVLLYTIPETMTILRQSRSKIYKLISERRLRTVREGRRTLVPATAIHDYIKLLEHEAEVA